MSEQCHKGHGPLNASWCALTQAQRNERIAAMSDDEYLTHHHALLEEKMGPFDEWPLETMDEVVEQLTSGATSYEAIPEEAWTGRVCLTHQQRRWTRPRASGASSKFATACAIADVRYREQHAIPCIEMNALCACEFCERQRARLAFYEGNGHCACASCELHRVPVGDQS